MGNFEIPRGIPSTIRLSKSRTLVRRGDHPRGVGTANPATTPSINTGRAARQVYQWRNIFGPIAICVRGTAKTFFRGDDFPPIKRYPYVSALRSARSRAQHA
jgi:hypothetical protein